MTVIVKVQLNEFAKSTGIIIQNGSRVPKCFQQRVDLKNIKNIKII